MTKKIELNPEQLAAVHYIDTPLLVLAGAGSGKTRVITQKIAWLIRTVGYAPHHVYAITFTNKAAKEMKERTLSLLRNQNSRGLSISTFHTLGLKILQHELQSAELKTGFSIFDAADSAHLIKELSPPLSANKEAVNAAQWQISAWKNQLISPAKALTMADDEIQDEQANLYSDYQRHLKAYNAVDFDDLIMKPVEILQNNPQVLEYWQNKIRYLLVDEYQDTNGSQYTLIKLLVGTRGALTVVGDDDQSVYAWRGARPENIIQLNQDYPHIKLIKLEQNYRSSQRILRAANQLISNNPHLFEKKLWSALGLGEQLKVITCKNETDEAERVASEIISHRFRHNLQYQDYAILYRSNHQARILEKTLRTQQVPYFLSGGTSFFSRTEIKDVMAYLRLIANPNDNSAFLRIVNVPRRKIGTSTLEKLATYANQREVSLLEASQEMGLKQVLNKAALNHLDEFATLIHQYQQIPVHQKPSELVNQLLMDISYDYWLHENSTNNQSAKRKKANVEDLIDWLDHLFKSDNGGNTLAELVRDLLLRDMLDRQEDDSGDQVRLMTLHAAKGLEFPHVYLIGMEEELLPHRNSIENDDIEEERRLAYVGITRAQQTLTMSYAKIRQKYGERTICEPSRFIDELPEEDIDWRLKNNSHTEEEKKDIGKAHIAQLRAMLAR